jgi:hypothetical protein
MFGIRRIFSYGSLQPFPRRKRNFDAKKDEKRGFQKHIEEGS